MESLDNTLANVDIEYLDYVKLFTKWPNKDGIRDRKGNYLIQGLFIDTADKAVLVNLNFRLPYTLRNADVQETNPKGEKVVYKSLYKIYMDSADEYQFAMRAFNSYQQFSILLTLEWFVNGKSKKSFAGLRSWREEKEMYDRSMNLQRIRTLADIGNVQAIKLIEERYKDTKPKNELTKSQKEFRSKEHEELKKDLNRAKLRLVKSDAKKDKEPTVDDIRKRFA